MSRSKGSLSGVSLHSLPWYRHSAMLFITAGYFWNHIDWDHHLNHFHTVWTCWCLTVNMVDDLYDLHLLITFGLNWNEPLNDMCLFKLASRLLQSYFGTDVYPSLCLIALAYLHSVYFTCSYVVTTGSTNCESSSHAEVVQPHSFTAGGTKASLFVMDAVKPVWLQTDILFVFLSIRFSHTFHTEVKRNISVPLHICTIITRNVATRCK